MTAPISAQQVLANQASPYPLGATPLVNSSGNVANAAAVATLNAVAGKTTYCTGFSITGTGATAGLPVVVTLAGLVGGTASFVYAAAAGALVANTPLIVNFPTPLPAFSAASIILLTCPALGAGNTNNCATIYGYAQ